MIVRSGMAFMMLIGMLLAACGGAATPPTVSTEPVDVQIKLTEFKIESNIKNFQKGVAYNFIVTNNGAIGHEFVILTTGSQHNMSNMPGMSGSGMHGEDTVIHIAESELPPGASKRVKVVFKEDTRASQLEMACHVPGHYEAGMMLGIAVN